MMMMLSLRKGQEWEKLAKFFTLRKLHAWRLLCECMEEKFKSYIIMHGEWHEKWMAGKLSSLILVFPLVDLSGKLKELRWNAPSEGPEMMRIKAQIN